MSLFDEKKNCIYSNGNCYCPPYYSIVDLVYCPKRSCVFDNDCTIYIKNTRCFAGSCSCRDGYNFDSITENCVKSSNDIPEPSYFPTWVGISLGIVGFFFLVFIFKVICCQSSNSRRRGIQLRQQQIQQQRQQQQQQQLHQQQLFQQQHRHQQQPVSVIFFPEPIFVANPNSVPQPTGMQTGPNLGSSGFRPSTSNYQTSAPAYGPSAPVFDSSTPPPAYENLAFTKH